LPAGRLVKPHDGLIIIPAHRVDRASGSFDDPSKHVHDDINDYGLIKQPKLSVVYAARGKCSPGSRPGPALNLLRCA
jgi:iron complex outermembrane receptor protein